MLQVVIRTYRCRQLFTFYSENSPSVALTRSDVPDRVSALENCFSSW